MNIDKLEILLAVVDNGSFSKAAEKLGYTQAGISYVIGSLEDEIGLTLLDRNFNGIKLNDDGQAVISDIPKIVDDSKRFREKVNTRKYQHREVLHIGSYDTISIKWIPEVFSLFETKYPDVILDMVTGDPFEINDWIADGTIDIGITEKLWAAKDYYWITIIKDPYYGIFPKDADISSPCSISDFENRKFYISDYGRDRNTPILLNDINSKVDFLYDRASTPSILKSIALGRGVTILSALSIDVCAFNWKDDKNAPKVIPIEPMPFRDLGVSLKKDRKNDRIIKAFISCLKNIMLHDCQNDESVFYMRGI